MTIKGLVFDFDGLILDTETPEYHAWDEIFQSYGTHLPLLEWAKVLGTSPDKFDIPTYLEKVIGKKIDKTAIREIYRQRTNIICNQQAALPGVDIVLQQAQEMGLRIGIASSSDYPWVAGHLQRLGLTSYFEAILTKDDVKEVKPNPELYQKAITALGLQPGEAIAFEDSPNGIRAAKDAGIFCVAVPNELSRELDTDYADMKIDSLDSIPLEEIIQYFNRELAH